MMLCIIHRLPFLFCLYLILFDFALQDVSPEDIPIMLVGNKCDLRQDGTSCVPTSYGEKLAMVMKTRGLLYLPNNILEAV